MIPPSVVETILDVARATPEAPAVQQGSRVLTYRALVARAADVCAALGASGLASGGTTTVAVGGRGRSPELVAAMIGVLGAGGVLLMIDPDVPASRSAAMADIAGARHVVWVGRRGLPEWAQSLPHTIVDAGSEIFTSPCEIELKRPGREHPAYVFFTSGSTGTPKGVLGAHHGLAHFIEWLRTTFRAGPADRCAALTRVSFDVMLRDVFLPLTSGACLVLPGDDDDLPDRVVGWLAGSEITWVHLVPSLTRVWIESASRAMRLPNLRATFFAGEALSDTLVREWRAIAPDSVIVNLYGPTETTLAKFACVLTADLVQGTQPVGRPLPDTEALVLTDDGSRCAPGAIGEIVIRTPFRTLGYVGAGPEDARRFRANPLTRDESDIVYYTGDLGRQRSDGQLEVCGRVDDQIKLHGVRIEPAEVERALIAECGLRDAVVTMAERVSGQRQLAAYVVAGARSPTATEMRAALEKILPRAFVPSTFVYLDAIPLNANGKRNRRALPPVYGSGAAVGGAADGDRLNRDRSLAVPSASECEARILAIWRSALGLSEIGAAEDVFTLGATSVIALAVAAKIGAEMNSSVPVGMILSRPTARGQAEWIEEIERYDARHIRQVAVVYADHRRRLAFAFPPLLGYGIAFHGIASHLTLHALHSFDLPDAGDPVTLLANAVRQADAYGPYTLVGYSAGGNLAFDVAVELERTGSTVERIVMLDSVRRERIEPMTDAEIDSVVWGNIENLAGLMRESEQFRDFARNEYVMERMAVKMRAYLRYESTTANTGETAADIHFVHSDERDVCTAWRDATRGRFVVYRGTGRHVEMTLAHNAVANGELLDRILTADTTGGIVL